MKDNKEKELENKFLLYVFGIWNIKNDVWNMKSKNSEMIWNSWLQNSLFALYIITELYVLKFAHILMYF